MSWSSVNGHIQRYADAAAEFFWMRACGWVAGEKTAPAVFEASATHLNASINASLE